MTPVRIMVARPYRSSRMGLVAVGVLKDLQLFVPDLLALDGAQAGQHGQVVEADGDHEHDVGHFGRQEQQALGHLLVGHIAQTP